MSILNSHQKTILKSALAFLAGSQLVHIYLNPLGDVQKLTEEKKSALWQEYLSEREKTKDKSKEVEEEQNNNNK